MQNLTLIIIVCTYVLAIIEAYIDVKTKPYYFWSNIIRGIVGFAVVVIYAWDFWSAAATIAFLFMGYMTVFNLSYNLFAGNYFFYLGTTSKIDRRFKEVELPFFVFTWLAHLMAVIMFLNINDLLVF